MLGRLMIWRLRRLLEWRRYVPLLARAAVDLLGPDTRVYVAGGAAEGRLTALSDIDVVIVSPSVPLDPRLRLRLTVELRERAVAYGIPWDYPFDIHVYRPEEFVEVRKRYGRLVPVEPVKEGCLK